MYTEKLEKIGLSHHESLIYTKLLEAGDLTAGILSKVTKIKRPTVYLTLKELEARGIVSEIVGKRKLFRAENPDKLYKITKRRRRKLIDDELELDQLIPTLLNITKHQTTETDVKVVYGMEAIKNLLEDISASRQSWYFFGSSENILKAIPAKDFQELLEETNKLREKATRPKVYFITDRGIKKITHFKAPKPLIREIKILPHIIKEKSALLIYENKVVILNIDENIFATVIESRETAGMVRLMFKMLWESIKS